MFIQKLQSPFYIHEMGRIVYFWIWEIRIDRRFRPHHLKFLINPFWGNWAQT